MARIISIAFFCILLILETCDAQETTTAPNTDTDVTDADETTTEPNTAADVTDTTEGSGTEEPTPPSDPCLSDPCENGGKCTVLENEVVCECAAGYTGDFCDGLIDPCVSEPCENEGNCTAQENKAFCTCTSDYTGAQCETAISACLSNPCPDEVCIPNDDGYECEDPCLGFPCKNEGRCIVSDNDFACQCAVGFTGRTCKTAITCEESLEILTYTIINESSVCEDNIVNDTVVFFNATTVGSFSYANVTCSAVCGGDQQEWVGARKCNNDGGWSTTWRTCDTNTIGNSVLDTADPDEITSDDVDKAADLLADVAALDEISQDDADSAVAVANNLLLANDPEAQQAVQNNSESILNSVDEVAKNVPLSSGTSFARYEQAESEFSLAVAGKNSVARALQTVYYGLNGAWDPSYNLAGSEPVLSDTEPTGSYIKGSFDDTGADRISFKMYVATNQMWGLSDIEFTKVVMSVDSNSSSEGVTFKFEITDSSLNVTGSIFNEIKSETTRKWTELFCERWDRATNKWEKEESCEKYSAKNSYALCTCKKSGEYIMRPREFSENIEEVVEGLSPGAIAGIVVGSVVGVVIIVGGVYYFCFSSKAKAKKKSAVTPSPHDNVELASHGNVAVDSNARADSSDED